MCSVLFVWVCLSPAACMYERISRSVLCESFMPIHLRVWCVCAQDEYLCMFVRVCVWVCLCVCVWVCVVVCLYVPLF